MFRTLGWFVALGLVAVSARGQPTISVTPTNGGTWDTPEYDPVTGKWNLTLYRDTSLTSNAEFTIRASDSEGIHLLNVELLDAAGNTFIRVLPKAGSEGVHSVDRIRGFDDNATQFSVSEARIRYNLGDNLAGTSLAIEADNVGVIVVGGDVVRGIRATSASVVSLDVGGDLLASVVAPMHTIGSIVVAGAIGPTALVNIDAMDGIVSVEAASINARIRGRQNGGDGIVHRVATTSGDFDGELDTRIFAPLSGVTSGVFIAGDMNATVTAESDLRTPFDVDGDLNGPITVRDLWIGTIGEPDGVITIGGDCNADITITRDISAGAGGTGRIDIAGNLNADITVAGMADGVIDIDGNFTSGTIDLAGDLDGTIAIAGSIIAGTIDVGDDINGAITVGDDIEAGGTILCQGDVNANITISDALAGLTNIGASLLSGRTIAVETLNLSGTPGQIIINSLAPSAGAGTWTGTVSVNSTAIASAPYYTTTGFGGAVGLAKFNLFDEECIPANGQPADPNEYLVGLSFYGPVSCASGFPFLIEWRSESDPEIWNDDTEHWSNESGLGTRNLWLLYFDENDPSIIPPDREYRITPYLTGSNALICADLLTTSTVAAEDFEYTFFTP